MHVCDRHSVNSSALHGLSHLGYTICWQFGWFHGLWNAGRDNSALRFILESDAGLTRARLNLVAATAQVIKTGLHLLSVRSPEEM